MAHFIIVIALLVLIIIDYIRDIAIFSGFTSFILLITLLVVTIIDYVKDGIIFSEFRLFIIVISLLTILFIDWIIGKKNKCSGANNDEIVG